MTIAALQLLGMGGGTGVLTHESNLLTVQQENTKLVVNRGIPNMLTVNLDVDAGPKQIRWDFTPWLNGSLIASVTFKANPTSLIISNTSFTAAGVVTAHVNTTGALDQIHWAKATITDNSSPAQVESRSIRVVTTRTT